MTDIDRLIGELGQLIEELRRGHQPHRDKDLLRTKDAARRLSVAESTMRALLDSGRIPSFRVSDGTRRIKITDLERFIAELEPWRVEEAS